MRWLLTGWAAVVLVLVGCAAHRPGTTTATQHAGQTALEVVIRLGLTQEMAKAAQAQGRFTVAEYRAALHTMDAGNEAAIELADSLAQPAAQWQIGQRAVRLLGVILPMVAEQLGATGAKAAELVGAVRQIDVRQAREDNALLALLRTRAEANLMAIDAELTRLQGLSDADHP